MNSSGKGMAIAGLILSSIGLLLTVINAAAGAFMAAAGRPRVFWNCFLLNMVPIPYLATGHGAIHWNLKVKLLSERGSR